MILLVTVNSRPVNIDCGVQTSLRLSAPEATTVIQKQPIANVAKMRRRPLIRDVINHSIDVFEVLSS